MNLPPGTVIPLRRTVSNSGLLERLPAAPLPPLPRDAGFEIKEVGRGHYQLIPYGNLYPPPRPWSTGYPLSPAEVVAPVLECVGAWSREVVERIEGTGQQAFYPFQEEWHRPVDEATLQRLGAGLAAAGARLFFHLFEEHDDPLLHEVVERWQQAARRAPMVLTVTAAEHFIPWGMLYLHPDPQHGLAPDGSNFRWEGFLGWRHIIEHNPRWVNLGTAIAAGEAGAVATSFNYDRRLDEELGVECIAPQRTFFADRSAVLDLVERTEKAELRDALAADPFADRIVYFCCHGRGALALDEASLQQTGLALSDGDLITGGEIAFWLQRRTLESQPFVFLNACQGGQMTTLLYRTIAVELMKRHAVGLVGPQLDVPAVFAAEYAQRFFRRLLGEEGGPPARVGEIVRDLARTFLEQHGNPLGLAYSLYRGVDCHLSRAAAEGDGKS